MRYKKRRTGKGMWLLMALLLLVTSGIVALRVSLLRGGAAPEGTAPTGGLPEGSFSDIPATPAPPSPAAGQQSTPESSPVITDTRDYSGLVCVSEVMSKNRATYLEGGAFPDYVELHSLSGQTLDLSGWRLSDDAEGPGWTFPSVTLEPDAYLLVSLDGRGELTADFSLSQGETLYLFSPSGQTIAAVPCAGDEADTALLLQPDGSYRESFWATPGYPNTDQGYLELMASRTASGPIVISEAMSANTLYAIQPDHDGEDWVELKNISPETVSLAGWHLSDDQKDFALWNLPDRSLEPGETLLVYCSGDISQTTKNYIHASFSLSSSNEHLYLSGPDGQLADYVHLHDIPANGSMGRLDGEAGFFYFTDPTPKKDNENGVRRVSLPPVTSTPDGVYNDTSGLSVELVSPGTVYYTTDGTVPTTESQVYEGPISVTETGVVRAIAVEEGALPSRVATFSYIVNENHTLPVLSLVVDDTKTFNSIYKAGKKYVDVAANLALYDGESSFNRQCSVSMKGWTSLKMAKKSFGVSFDGIYGGDLDCDVFGNGITRYDSLSIRAGQDYISSIFRNELFQELGLEISKDMYVQYSKYCILYINGEYRGIYCLKEDYSRQYYASRNGIDKESVIAMRTPVALESEYFQEIIKYFRGHDLSKEENYKYICDRVDIDNLIDWFILEGYSANTDIQGNARVFRSPETGNKWQFGAYDFDWAFYYSRSDFTIIMQYNKWGNAGDQIPPLIVKLMKNADFRQRFLKRFSELNATVLSNEHVLAKIDELQALLEPEAPRDRERWKLKMETWYEQVDKLRAFITDSDWANHNIMMLDELINLTKDEFSTYFPNYVRPES